jgi:hypothetical protein
MRYLNDSRVAVTVTKTPQRPDGGRRLMSEIADARWKCTVSR